MTKDRNILLVLALILAFFAAWRIFSYRASHGEKNPAVVENIQHTKAPELFAEKTVYSANKNEASPSAGLTSNPSTILPASNTETTFTTQPDKNIPSSSSGAVTAKATNRPFFSHPSRTSSQSYSSSTVAATPKNTPRNTPSASTTARQSYAPSVSEQMAQERANNLSPYLIPNKEAQKKLDADFKNLNNALSRAIQKALTPKSKKNANIEKYLHRDATATAPQPNADPFQEMLAQIATQKTDIVQSVTEAFGNQAGQRAGQLMDNFQKDLTAEVSKTDQQPQVTAQNIQKIAQTYQQKFDRMNQQNQYNQYVKELTAQYNSQAESLKKLYPDQDELNDEFTRISNEALQKELSLPSQKLTPEQYAQARYDIQYNMRQEMEKAVRDAGTSLNGLHQYDNERANDILKDLEQREEAGTIVSVPRKESVDNTNALSMTLLKEQQDTLAQIEQAYGVQARADFKPVLDEYYQEMMKTTQELMTPSQRYHAKEHLRVEYSRRLLEKQREAISKMENVSPQQKEEALQAIEKEINALPKM